MEESESRRGPSAASWPFASVASKPRSARPAWLSLSISRWSR